ncbi:MAG TPA: DUF6687 family protein [Acidimicrobiales bacterium]|nr:DUF6687 family protein [Acidimicrobiales bacterium]
MRARAGAGAAGLPFVPLSEVGDRPNVMADGAALPSTVLTLSHWPGSSTPEPLRDDLSAGIAFRFLRSRRRWWDRRAAPDAVTLDHFDQDGLVTVYAVADPVGALARRDQLLEVAAAGDFDRTDSRVAARVAFALDRLAPQPRADPHVAAAAFREAVGLVPALVDHPESFRHLWEEEDGRLAASEDAIAAGTITITEDRGLDLAIVDATHPDLMHPMTVHNRTLCTRVLVLSPPQYELYFRYETWVRIVSRLVRGRVDLTDLADRLSAAEPGGASWRFNGTRATIARLTPTEAGRSDLAPDVVRRWAEEALAAAA